MMVDTFFVINLMLDAGIEHYRFFSGQINSKITRGIET